MLAGDGLYMKFNRELTKNEEVFGTAIERATDVLRAQGGPTILDALTDSIKVGCSLLPSTLSSFPSIHLPYCVRLPS